MVDVIIGLPGRTKIGFRNDLSQRRTRAARAPSSTARQFKTGSAPGRPRQTGQVFELGWSPKRVEQPQKILDSVLSCACTSRPIMVSQLFVIGQLLVVSSQLFAVCCG